MVSFVYMYSKITKNIIYGKNKQLLKDLQVVLEEHLWKLLSKRIDGEFCSHIWHVSHVSIIETNQS